MTDVTSATSPPPSATLTGSLDERLSALLSSSSQFSVAAYLNLALESSSDSDELQQRMAELALQLQLQTQTCHEDIGRIGAELQAILPRCAADVGRVGVGLEGMRLDAQALLEATAVENEQQELSSSLETLSTLHALQANLSRTKEVLTAAATWDSTMSSIPPLLAQQNLTEAVNALAQLENGERALRGMPNPEERQESIAKIRQQVQVLLQPQLKHALQNMNTRLAPLQQCVALYTKLDKMESLRDEYVKNRPGSVHKAWFAYTPPYTSTNEEGSNERMGSSESFETWLPTWYETVLSLLTEERRQASSVFGSEAAPEIIVKVMKECFRPILPSFQSRLEALFSSNPAFQAKGSLESICAAYESTLRFLSVAYELVSGAFLDVAESGMGKKGDTGINIYNDMLEVFLQVASPFTNYLQRFSELEGKHLQVSTALVCKDIHQAVGSVSSTSELEILQDAIERLKDLAPFIFPMTEGSLNRFELLNGGYMVSPALAAVDKIITNHIEEVAIAIRTMSAAMTNNVDHLAEVFDEQHVLCALEVLKLAGAFVRDLSNFEGKTRDRLSILAERVSDHMKQEAEVEKAGLSKGGKSASSFSLPDAISVVEIDSVLTRVFCGEESDVHDVEENPSLSMLQRLANAEEADRPLVALYPDSMEAIKRLAHSCHSFVFDVCASVPRKHLSGMSGMTAWNEAASTNEFDSYGTLPQSYITHVGEHMLALVQALEPFAADPQSLSVANEVMSGVREVALQPWSEFIASAGVFGVESIVDKLMDGKDISELVLNNVALTEEDAELEEGVSEEEKASAEFCNAWLDVVGLAVTGRLLERVMRIPQLTAKGCEHLSADLNYLINVFSALGVAGHPHPLVSHLAALANLSDDELKDHVLQRDRSNELESALRAVEARIALLRGLSL